MQNAKQVSKKQPWITPGKVVILSAWRNPMPTSCSRHLHSTWAFPDTHSQLKRADDYVDTWESRWKSCELPWHTLVQASWEQLASWRWAGAGMHVRAVAMRNLCNLYMPGGITINANGNHFLAGCDDIERCSENQMKICFSEHWAKALLA